MHTGGRTSQVHPLVRRGRGSPYLRLGTQAGASQRLQFTTTTGPHTTTLQIPTPQTAKGSNERDQLRRHAGNQPRDTKLNDDRHRQGPTPQIRTHCTTHSPVAAVWTSDRTNHRRAHAVGGGSWRGNRSRRSRRSYTRKQIQTQCRKRLRKATLRRPETGNNPSLN